MGKQIVLVKLSLVTLVCLVALALLPIVDIFRQIKFYIYK